MLAGVKLKIKPQPTTSTHFLARQFGNHSASGREFGNRPLMRAIVQKPQNV